MGPGFKGFTRGRSKGNNGRGRLKAHGNSQWALGCLWPCRHLPPSQPHEKGDERAMLGAGQVWSPRCLCGEGRRQLYSGNLEGTMVAASWHTHTCTHVCTHRDTCMHAHIRTHSQDCMHGTVMDKMLVSLQILMLKPYLQG